MDQLLAGHGPWPYLATFAWAFLEGETFLLFAAFAAAQGLLNAPLLLLAAWLGSFGGDQCYFWIGRTFGHRVLARRPRWGARVERVLAILRRYDAGFILGFRFLYGVRNVASFAIGISGVGWLRFMLLNLVAAFLWAASFVAAGYWSGRAMQRTLGASVHYLGVALVVLLAALLLAAGVRHLLRRRRAAAETPPSGPRPPDLPASREAA